MRELGRSAGGIYACAPSANCWSMPSTSTFVTKAWSSSSKRVERHDANNTSKSIILAYEKEQSRLIIDNAFKTANPCHHLASAKKIP